MKCEQEMCPFWSGSGCICEAVDIGPTDRNLARNASEGWACYAAEQERHAETAEKVGQLEAKLARSVSWSEVIRALRAADVPEDSMATDDDLIRYEGRAEAVTIMRDMLGV